MHFIEDAHLLEHRAVRFTLEVDARGIVQQRFGTDGLTHSAERETTELMSEIVTAHGDRFPAVSAAFQSARSTDDQDAVLEFGLARIFDGLEAVIETR